ncbi:MAG TPA: MBL fold metallo-hydrolase [Aeromicrobium sp.]|nr:MBL fold metallo-hydrolase [Aeromicrobium sp.]HKY57847.1 MBL fold metallo-hydrolase [Aeromicrobium sp.]
MHVTRFGHSAVLVEAAGQRVLIDPGAFSSPDVFEVEGLDAIVVTHQHVDHLDRDRIAGLIERNPGAVRLSDPETAALVDGFTAHSDTDVTELGAITITGVGTTHAEILPVIPRVTNTGVLITSDGEPTLFHPGDAYAYAPEGVDILAAPLSAPWTKVSETVDFVRRVDPHVVFPIHDAGVTPLMHGIYWGHLSTHAGVSEPRNLGPADTATLQ